MTGEHARVVVARRFRAELGGEPRLADARLTRDEHEVRAAAGQRGVERRAQHRELFVASDERRAGALAALTRRREGLHGDERLDGLLATLHGDQAERLVAHTSGRGRVRGGADHHLAGLGSGLQAAGRVHHVAHCRVVAPGSERADEHLTGVHPNAHLELEARLGPHLHEVLLHAQRSPHRALGVVLVRDRCAEQRHQRIADHLVDLSAERGDVVRQPREAPIDEVLHLLRVGGLGEARVAHEVREEHRGDAPLVGSRDERVSAHRAEPGIGRHRRTAGRTGHAPMLRPGVTPVRSRIPDVTCV